MGKAVVVAGVIGVAVAAVVGGSYVVGGSVETGFKANVAAMNSGGLQVRVVDYRRGLFGAQAQTLWTFDEGDEPIEFSVTHDIDHGPLPAGKAAQVRSQLVVPEDLAQTLGSALQGRAPLEVETRVGWRGEQVHRISSPAYTGKIGDDLDLNWGGIRGEFTVSGDGLHARGSIEAPALDIRDQEGSALVVERVALTLDSQRPQPYRFWTGPSSIKVKRAAFSSAGEGVFELEGLQLGSMAALDGEVVNLSVDFGLDKAVGGGETVEAVSFVLALDRIDAGALDAIARIAQEAGSAAEDMEARQARLVGGLMEQLPVLLSRSPVIELKKMGARLVEGAAELGVRIAYTGSGDMSAFNPVNDVTGNLRLSLPKALLLRLVEMKERQTILDYVAEMEIDADSQEIEDAVRTAVAERLQSIAGGGLLEEKDGLLTSAVSYKDGAFEVNGRALAPEEFGELGLPF